jgi:2-amino-4-hydroxy-6-hydroxymethyldihydropteridine diphosphokinase
MKAFIGVGSNLGARKANLRRAESLLGSEPGVQLIQKAPLSETDPVGGPPQGRFLNTVWKLETRLSPHDLLAVLQRIESQLGRERGVPNGPRTIDLDILFYENLVVDQPGLRIPHPRLHERLFVLRPLCWIDPDWVHPTLGKSVRTLCEEIEKTEAVRDRY